MCKYCEKVDFQNVAGKEFFIPLDDIQFSNHKGDICVALNGRGEYTLHYEAGLDAMLDVGINFCPICGRNLKENNHD